MIQIEIKDKWYLYQNTELIEKVLKNSKANLKKVSINDLKKAITILMIVDTYDALYLNSLKKFIKDLESDFSINEKLNIKYFISEN